MLTQSEICLSKPLFSHLPSGYKNHALSQWVVLELNAVIFILNSNTIFGSDLVRAQQSLAVIFIAGISVTALMLCLQILCVYFGANNYL